VWVPKKPQDPRDPREIPEQERSYFLEERYPKYGNLVPRDIATREIFDICTTEGLSVEKDKLCVYLDLTHIPRETLDRKLGGILEIYEKFQGVDPRAVPMKIFPAVHYSMGGLWVDYERSASGGMVEGAARNQQTSIPGLYAIGECDYQYHGANRLGANSLLSCIFSGLFVAPTLAAVASGQRAAADQRLFDGVVQREEERHRALLARPSGGENPYDLHQELGSLMTRVATVVRRNDQLAAAYGEVCTLEERWRRCGLSDTGNWTNQNVVFAKSLGDMFPVAKLVRSLRGKHPSLAEVHDRQVRRRRQPADLLRRRGHLADPPAAAALRTGGGGGDRGGVEGAAGRRRGGRTGGGGRRSGGVSGRQTQGRHDR
jgi:succinate dehydrogenase / fumarate reductase flavoprotein subunit